MKLGGYDLSDGRRGRAVVLRSPLLSNTPTIQHGFATRNGGVSQGSYATLNFGVKGKDHPENIVQNRKRLCLEVGLGEGWIFRMSQVHGDRVRVVRAADRPEAMINEPGDGVISATSGRAVAVATADCVPVLLAHEVAGVVAAVHAGWRGLRRGILAVAVNRLQEEFGATLPRLRVALGPAIGPCCYEVGDEVADHFTAVPDAVIRHGGKNPHLDLHAVAQHQLLNLGIREKNLDRPELCTRCQSDHFFSYRRDGARSGHMLSVICVDPQER